MTSAKYHAKYDLHPLGYGGFFNVFLSGMSASSPVAARADAGDSQRHGDIAVCGTGACLGTLPCNLRCSHAGPL